LFRWNFRQKWCLFQHFFPKKYLLYLLLNKSKRILNKNHIAWIEMFFWGFLEQINTWTQSYDRVVKFYNAASSLARFENKNISFGL
jgi:hypothetical protein